MIVLDTNILRGIAIDSSSAELIRALRTSGAQEVAVPWVVLEELASQWALKYRETYEQAERALRELRRVTPWGSVPQLGPSTEEQSREHWRARYRMLVDVLETSPEALREAIVRESNRIAPCKSAPEKAKTGARDAAIWLTAIEYAQENPDQTVYFVSDNTRDFGNGTSYRPPMDADLAYVRERFVHLTSLDDVVSKFANPTETEEGHVCDLLASETSLSTISAVSRSTMPVLDNADVAPASELNFACTAARPSGDDDFSTASASCWAAPPEVIVASVSHINAYSIGADVWVTATARWFFTGGAILRDPFAASWAGCAWETRVLLSAATPASRLTVIGHTAPQTLSSAEMARLPEKQTPWGVLHVTGRGELWSILNALKVPGQKLELRLDDATPAQIFAALLATGPDLRLDR